MRKNESKNESLNLHPHRLLSVVHNLERKASTMCSERLSRQVVVGEAALELTKKVFALERLWLPMGAASQAHNGGSSDEG